MVSIGIHIDYLFIYLFWSRKCFSLRFNPLPQIDNQSIQLRGSKWKKKRDGNFKVDVKCSF